MTLSEHDLRILGEIEHDLQLSSPRRRLSPAVHPLLLAALGLMTGSAFIAVGLWSQTAGGVVLAVAGFATIVASAHAAGRAMWAAFFVAPRRRWRRIGRVADSS